MTLGTGIFASTILVLLAVALWQVTKHRRWRLVGTVLGVLVGLTALIALGVWGWTEYANRPTPQRSLAGIALGMVPVEVKLRKGEPQSVSPFTCGRPLSSLPKEGRFNDLDATQQALLPTLTPEQEQLKQQLLLELKRRAEAGMPGTRCGPPNTSEARERWFFPDMHVVFKTSNNGLKVSSICRDSGTERLIGVSPGAPESDVLAELGKPTYVSIRNDGLAKVISYRQWNVAFELEKGRVSAMCVAEGDVRYPDEYGSSTTLEAK